MMVGKNGCGRAPVDEHVYGQQRRIVLVVGMWGTGGTGRAGQG
jgi:hypothetical protein